MSGQPLTTPVPERILSYLKKFCVISQDFLRKEYIKFIDLFNVLDGSGNPYFDEEASELFSIFLKGKYSFDILNQCNINFQGTGKKGREIGGRNAELSPEVEEGAYTKATFTEGVKRCFLKTGLAPNGEGEFTQYEKAVSKGTMSRPPAGTVHKDEFIDDANDCFLRMKDFEHFEELDDMLYGAPEDEGDESEGDESEGDESEGDESEGDEIDIDENE